MTIDESNKLIAIFMGAKEDRYPDCMPNHVELWGKWEDNISAYNYRFSWDWLMPVVLKIGKECDVRISIMPTVIDVTSIERPDTVDNEISSMGGMSPIENTYHAVVKFIEWYNTKSKYRNAKQH